VPRQSSAGTYEDVGAFGVDDEGAVRPSDVALAVRRVLEELAVS
jgi:hypothetical protein